jgi:uncharacterized protein YkwD
MRACAHARVGRAGARASHRGLVPTRLFAVVAVAVAIHLPASPTEAAGPPPPTVAAWSASPVSVDVTALEPLERDVLALCGVGEAGLQEVARGLARLSLRGERLPELDGLEGMLRAAGEPHPWPRAWSARGRSLESPSTTSKLRAWLGADRSSRRRCGVAVADAPDGTRALVVVTVDALADLAPMPTRVRAGQWLTVEGRLLARATSATVVVLEGEAPPRIVPSWIEGGVVRARFAPTRPGEIDVQFVADLASGPRPVIEATAYSDVDPVAALLAAPADVAAPGESATAGDDPATDADRLLRAIAIARAAAGLEPLRRDPRLDRIARAHAEAMAARHELAHDAGDGDPLDRLRASGLDPHAAGENVAHAPTLALAHRALWRSPSHRLNLLGRSTDRVGVAVVRGDGDGNATAARPSDESGEPRESRELREPRDVWVVETFAGGL